MRRRPQKGNDDMITWNQPDSSTYAQVIDLVAAMVRDRYAQALARERGLHILDVT
jgi:hypothetical protein